MDRLYVVGEKQGMAKDRRKKEIGMEKISLEDAIEELSLMLMYLERFSDRNENSPFLELSWKGYDFDVLDKLDDEELIVQPKKSKYVYLTEKGKTQARILLRKYNLPDVDLWERFDFRTIRPEEGVVAAQIEEICFPPNEACNRERMLERMEWFPDMFLVAADKQTGKIAGVINGLATNEHKFRDEFFTDVKLHDPEGKNVMILGVAVLPEYRRQGLAREMMFEYLRREQEKGREIVFLTCLAGKVKMYKKLGFLDRGIGDSTWGGEQWHEMSCFIS